MSSHTLPRREILRKCASLLLLAAGCTVREGRQGTAKVVASGGKRVLEFWNGFTGPDGQTMEQMVARFRQQNPDLQVRMQIIPWGTYYDKLTLALAYGGAPEVFVVHAARLPEYASFETLRPLEDLFSGQAFRRSGVQEGVEPSPLNARTPERLNAASAASPPLTAADFAPAAWRAAHYGGRQLALPLDIHPHGLYYNTRLFEEAGVVDRDGRARPPVTWEEFLEAATRLTRDTDGDGRPDQWGFAFTWPRANWISIAAQFGGGILSADSKTCRMDAPESLAAIRRMRDLITRYRVAPKPEGVDAWLAFRQGKVAMALDGIYMLHSLEEEKGLAFAGAPTPRFGPRPGTWAGSHMLCQPAGIAPEQARAAWRLMRFLSDHSLMWARGGQIPARLSVQRSPEFAALPVQSQFARQLSYVQFDPLTPRGNALSAFVDPAIEAALLGLDTPETAMRDACRRIRQVLERP